jgi:hypothetical protein
MTRSAVALLALAMGYTLALQVNEVSAAPGVSPWNQNCIKFYKQWKKKAKHKAFAVSRSDYQESCGGTWGAKSKKAAEDGARKWYKKGSVGGASCRITDSE